MNKRIAANKWMRSKAVITAGIIIMLFLAITVIGPLFTAGENPIKISVTLWYLNQSSLDVVKMAAEQGKYVTVMDEELTERIVAYVPRISNSLGRGWEIKDHHERGNHGYLVLAKENGDELEIIYTPYLDQYVIFELAEAMEQE